jgi:hypothetical protein
MRGCRIAAVAAISTGLALTACQLIANVKDEEGILRPDDASTNASDAGVTDAIVPLVLCGDALPPGPPAQTNQDNFRTLNFAVSALHVRPAGDPPLGYNLDQRCTVKSDPLNQRPCTGATGDDDPGGADNAFGNAVDEIGKQFMGDAGTDAVTKAVNRAIGLGANTMLLSLKEYGGFDGGTAFANDSEITFGLAPSMGLESSGCGSDAGDAGGGPHNDGCDVWTHVPGGTIGDPPTIIGTLSGYVRDGEIVAHGDELTLAFGVVRITVHSPVLTAKLSVGDAGSFPTLKNGVIAGRVHGRELVSTALTFSITSDGTMPVCQSMVGSEAARTTICARRDLPLLPADDGKLVNGKLVACDSVSIAFGFDAVTATVGSVGLPLPEKGICSPDFDASCE